MHSTGGVSPLAIVLPHPALPARHSARLSAAPSPRTPRSCPSPACSSIFFASANRKSTDSWNSSNGPDELESDWQPEHTLLLSRTLDALPAHLVTPFNGPIPPSNLLDKIARGVAQAKGPVDWPHSIRATRVKLIDLARTRAKDESAAEDVRRSIPEEVDDVEIHDASNYAYDIPRRPLYRQSSMDFMTVTELKDSDAITRLSNRLQRPSYHPYSRTPRSNNASPPRPTHVPSLINPSTPSSSTLSSLLSSRPRTAIRRTASSLSSSSASSTSMLNPSSAYPYLLPAMASDPRVQRIRRTDSFCPPTPPPKDTLPTNPTAGIKRAPSFGTLAQEAKQSLGRDKFGHFDRHIQGLAASGVYPSSDEEEKMRSKQAKKPRVKKASVPIATPVPPTPVPASSSPIMSSPMKQVRSPVRSKSKQADVCLETMKSPKTPKKGGGKEAAGYGLGKANFGGSSSGAVTPVRPMNVHRNPSILGGELPHLRIPLSPRPIASSQHPPSTPREVQSPDSGPTTQKVKTLRRVKRLAPARRISFGSLVAPGDDADAEGDVEEERGLGSAFQLQ